MPYPHANDPDVARLAGELAALVEEVVPAAWKKEDALGPPAVVSDMGGPHQPDDGPADCADKPIRIHVDVPVAANPATGEVAAPPGGWWHWGDEVSVFREEAARNYIEEWAISAARQRRRARDPA